MARGVSDWDRRLCHVYPIVSAPSVSDCLQFWGRFLPKLSNSENGGNWPMTTFWLSLECPVLLRHRSMSHRCRCRPMGWSFSHFVDKKQGSSLVGGLEHFLSFHTLGIIIPIDFHISEGWLNHQPDQQMINRMFSNLLEG